MCPYEALPDLSLLAEVLPLGVGEGRLSAFLNSTEVPSLGVGGGRLSPHSVFHIAVLPFLLALLCMSSSSPLYYSVSGNVLNSGSCSFCGIVRSSVLGRSRVKLHLIVQLFMRNERM